MRQERLGFTWKHSGIEQRQVGQNNAPLGSDWENEMHIWYWKNISILAKVTQVSDVAHGPLVFPSSGK
jgi:hypothetical protein